MLHYPVDHNGDTLLSLLLALLVGVMDWIEGEL
jgi:hypothetical protein